MKKICLIFLCLFLVTGCDIEYNLDVDNYVEDVSVVENDYNNWSYSASSLNMMELNDFYLQKPLALEFSNIDSEGMIKNEGIAYYDVQDLSDDDKIGLSFNGQFKKDNSNSTLVWQGCEKFQLKKYSDSVSFIASGFKIFDQYKNLDKITVNLKSKYGDLENNADSVGDGVYTWVITSDNYREKSINIKFDTSGKISFFENSMVRFAIVILFLIIFGYLIYKFVIRKSNKANSL